MTEITGRGRLGAAAAARLLALLGSLPGVVVSRELRWRARPRGIEDGFDAGADADRVLGIDPEAPGELAPLGDDLASLELELVCAGAPWVLAVVTQRDEVGTTWTAHLDPLDEEANPPSWWPEVLRCWGSSS